MSNLPDIIVPQQIVSKAQHDTLAMEIENRILESNGAVHGYVFVKQLEQVVKVLVTRMNAYAKAAYTGPNKIGAARIEMTGGKPRDVVVYAPEVLEVIRQEEEIIAGSQARIELLKAHAVQDGKFTTIQETSPEVLKVTFDK